MVESRTVPRELELDPAECPTGPVQSRLQELPFEQLTWQNFERLCLRLVRLEADVKFCRFYGNQGDEQEGIDLYAKKGTDPKYRVYQCKNQADFGPAKIKEAVQEFLKGDWVEKTNTFILCTREGLRSQQRADEVELQREALRQESIGFETWDADELNTLLKGHPTLVDDFFGRAWAEAFCGNAQLHRDLSSRLDGPAAAQLRGDLRTLYESIFKLADPGFPADAARDQYVPLERRYVVPDVVERRVRLLTVGQHVTTGQAQKGEPSGSDAVTREEEVGYRRSIDEWLRENPRAILLGGPGVGKSTLLRFLALDLLSFNPRFESFSRVHATRIPIWVPFAYWTSVLGREEASAKSLDDVLEQWLHQLGQDAMATRVRRALNDDRLLLLVDGLDEYRSEESATVALAQISVLVARRSCPVIATCRPAAFGKLNAFHLEWRSAQLAEFSSAQQQELAEVWFRKYFEANTALERGADVEKLSCRAAEELVAEIRKSAGLVDLAGTPLLLVLLIHLKMSNSPLPNNRFEAYRVLVNHLIAIHPATRRKAAFLTGAAQQTFSLDDLRAVFAALAFSVAREHPDGNFVRSDALTYVTAFLADEHRGFGYRRPEALQHAGEVVSLGESNLGLLVERAPDLYSFLHRVFFEYLAACYLGKLSIDEQSAYIAEKATDPQWREILLCFLHQLVRQDDVDRFVNQLRSLRKDELTKTAIDPILCELAVGQFNLSLSLCNSVCSEIIEEIETGLSLPQRAQLLRLILSGIYSRKVSRLISERMARWYPGRSTWRPDLFEIMARVAVGHDVVNGALIRGLWDEARTNQRAAARALALRAGTSPEMGGHLIGLLRKPQNTGVIAAISEALLLGWRDHEVWNDLEPQLRSSPSFDLRILAIRRRVLQKRATVDDKNELLYLGSRDFALAWPYKDLTPESLLEGWPNDQEIRDRAIEAIEPRIFRERSLDNDIATELLIKGFMTEPGAVAAVAKIIRTEEYPFLSGTHAAWKLLSEKCAGNKELIAAADEWLGSSRSQHHQPEVSFAARLGWTAAAKRRLLENLDSWVPFWSAEALLDGWGMEDADVGNALNRLASSGKASEIGYLLPRIIADETECYERLIELLGDAKCSRPESVLAGLAGYPSAHADKIIDAALPWLQRDSMWSGSFRHQLMQLFPMDSRVRELALKELDKRMGNITSVLLAYSSDAEIIDRVAAISTPLPTALREEIVAFAETNANASEFCLHLLSLFDVENDPQLKTRAAIAYFEVIWRSGMPHESLLEHLKQEIICGGPDFHERRQAAFCGLDILGRLDVVRGIFRNKQDSLALDFSVQSRPNLPFVRHVLGNWTRIRAGLQEQFEAALFGSLRMGQLQQWTEIAEVGEDYREPKEVLVPLLENNRDEQLREEVLRFIARIYPKSPLLLRECLRIIRGEGRSTHRWPDIDAAAELLGRDFSGDKAVLGEVLKPRSEGLAGHLSDAQLWALCEGWPNSVEIVPAYEDYRRNPLDWGFSPLGMQLLCAKGTAAEIIEVLTRILSRSLKDFGFYSRALTRPILKRINRDEAFRNQLIERIGQPKNVSEEVTFARLLYLSGGFDSDLRKWCYSEEGIVRWSGIPWPGGTDLTAGNVRTKCEVATEILWGRTRS